MQRDLGVGVEDRGGDRIAIDAKRTFNRVTSDLLVFKRQLRPILPKGHKARLEISGQSCISRSYLLSTYNRLS